MKKGFTLAEVLITLGIIGVVSALTLPNVISGYNEKVLMTQLQRNYNMIRSVVPNAMQKEGVMKTKDLVSDSDVQKNVEFLRKYFGVTTVCTKATGWDKCLASSYHTLKEETATANDMMRYSVKDCSKAACAVAETGATICVGHDMDWLIDVNGKDKPNKYGSDVFWFRLNKDAQPELAEESRYKGQETYDADIENTQLNGDNCNSTNGSYSVRDTSCFAKIISNGWKFD